MPRYEFVEGTSSKFWEIALAGKSFTTTYGRIGADGQSTKKSFASPAAAAKEYEKLIGEKTRKGYKLVGGAAPAAPKAAAKTTAKPAPKPARSAAKKPSGPHAEAYVEAFTSPIVHFMKLSPAKPNKPEAAPRATSGGRPIMAEGQKWPTCSGCGENLSLFLQFDIEPDMGLGFIPGSHLLVFNCARCDGMAMIVPNKKLPKEWLSPDNPQTYRVILNRPAAREAIFPADPTVLEQLITFKREDEKLNEAMEDDEDDEEDEQTRRFREEEPPRGRGGFKVGGIPARIQGWMPPRCNCGAPLGFIFQVPLSGPTGWKSRDRQTLGEFLGLDTFIHGCTKQCSPYATIVIPDR
jgi:predicted DNA-binding WGR domain protein